MSWFSSFVTAISAAGICFGGLYIICPTGKISKPVKYVFSLCFLIIILTTAGFTIPKTNFDFFVAEDFSVDYTETEISIARSVYATALKNADIEFSRIEIFTDKLEDGSINIIKISVYTSSEKQRVLDALGQVAENFEVEVINE